MMEKIEAFEMWIWRRCLKISYTDQKINIEVLQEVGENRKLKKEIIKRKLQYFGHLIRKDGIQKKWTGKGYEQLYALTEDRSCWRRIISNVLVEQDTCR